MQHRFPATEIKFDENAKAILESDPNSHNIGERVQLLRVGKFVVNPGRADQSTVEVTIEMLQSMVNNFNERIRGVDIAIDYKHESDDVAAGWIKEIELCEDSLYATRIDWTPNGLRKLADKEFRYISAEFDLNYKDNESMQSFGPTLLGAGLTNRPVVKRMEPIVQLSEIDTNQALSNELKAELKGAKMADQKQQSMAVQPVPAPASAPAAAGSMTPEEMMAKIKELQAIIDQLKSEKEAVVAAKELAEKKSRFAQLLSEGKAVPAQEKSFLDGDMEKFVSLSQPVNLSEKGNSSVENKKDSQDQIIELAQKRAKENGVDIADAISQVLSENPELHKEYQKAVSL